ncbi:hypothetical protein [Leifsonia sp. Le1]|uniref:hypothetical protein n=1 Tax=Leifsonia sp. Le1 TaxID=3404918 RepID=UPI003EC1459E
MDSLIPVIWLWLAIMTGGLAQAKGRSGWTWFVLGLILGPIAATWLVAWKQFQPTTPAAPASPAPPSPTPEADPS